MSGTWFGLPDPSIVLIKAQFEREVIRRAKSQLRARVLTHHSSLITHHCLILFCRGEDGWCVVGNANREAAVVSEAGEPFDAGEIKAKSGSTNLHSEACFGLRFSPKRTITWSGIGAPSNLAGDTELLIQAEDPRRAIRQYIVLRKQLCWRGQNCNSNVSECVKPSVVSKLLANQYRPIGIRLIQSDSPGLIRVRQSDANTKT